MTASATSLWHSGDSAVGNDDFRNKAVHRKMEVTAKGSQFGIILRSPARGKRSSKSAQGELLFCSSYWRIAQKSGCQWEGTLGKRLIPPPIKYWKWRVFDLLVRGFMLHFRGDGEFAAPSIILSKIVACYDCNLLINGDGRKDRDAALRTLRVECREQEDCNLRILLIFRVREGN